MKTTTLFQHLQVLIKRQAKEVDSKTFLAPRIEAELDQNGSRVLLVKRSICKGQCHHASFLLDQQ